MHDAPDVRIPAPRRSEPQHRPWCTDHLHGDNAFGMCIGTDIDLPGLQIGLRWEPGQPVCVSVAAGDHMETVTLDELEQRSLAMLTLALVGRGATPPASAFAAVTA